MQYILLFGVHKQVSSSFLNLGFLRLNMISNEPRKYSNSFQDRLGSIFREFQPKQARIKPFVVFGFFPLPRLGTFVCMCVQVKILVWMHACARVVVV